jgi:putative addiction module component (TIGR02574 family)
MAMTESTITAPPGFSQLSKAEQIRYLQALWDRIAESPTTLPVPESHLKLVEQRLKQRHDDPSSTPSALEVLDQLSSESA